MSHSVIELLMTFPDDLISHSMLESIIDFQFSCSQLSLVEYYESHRYLVENLDWLSEGKHSYEKEMVVQVGDGMVLMNEFE